MLDDISVLTGIRAGGKTKIGIILMLALNNNPKVRFVDMSKAVVYFLARPTTPIGKQLQQYRQIMNDGGLITDGRLIYTALMGYVAALDREQGRSTQHLILAGGMRTVEEAKCLLACGAAVTVIHIDGDENDVMIGINRRLDAGDLRTDSMSPQSVERFWHDYRLHTIPALKLCHNYNRLCFGMTMRDKINACIDIMEFPGNVKTRMKRRINAGNHAACIEIEKLDHPKKQAHAAHSTTAMASDSQAKKQHPNYPFVQSERAFVRGTPTGQITAPQ